MNTQSETTGLGIRAPLGMEKREMSDIAESWTPDQFTPPGIVKVSPSALEIARAVGEEGIRAVPGKDWVMTFYWYLSETVTHPDSSREEHGPGLDVGGLERWQIPADRIETVDGFEFAIQIPKDVCEAATERLIDREDETSTAVILR